MLNKLTATLLTLTKKLISEMNTVKKAVCVTIRTHASQEAEIVSLVNEGICYH